MYILGPSCNTHVVHTYVYTETHTNVETYVRIRTHIVDTLINYSLPRTHTRTRYPLLSVNPSATRVK